MYLNMQQSDQFCSSFNVLMSQEIVLVIWKHSADYKFLWILFISNDIC